jgi:PAS domain S-box-containing protein
MKKKHISKYHTLSFATIIIFIIVIFIAYNYYIFETKYIKREASRDLKSVSDIRACEISQWIRERIIDGNFIKASVPLRNFLLNPNDRENIIALKKRFEMFSLDSSYTTFRVFNKERDLLYSNKEYSVTISHHLLLSLEKSLESDSVILSDFFFDEFHKSILLELIIPVSNEGEILGFVLIDVNPEEYIYRTLQNYSIAQSTSELLLVRREGDDALFLNDLRFKKDAALQLRIPITAHEVPAIHAIKGDTGTVEGIDYRGERVIADVRKIPSTNWYIIAKVDISEINAPLRDKAFVLIFLVLFIFTILIAFLVIFWLTEKRALLVNELKSQRKMRLLGEYLNAIIESSSSAIYDLDREGNVKSIWNKSAEKMFGFKREDVIGKRLSIVPAEKDNEFSHLMSIIFEGKSFTDIEVERQKSSGERILISLSAAPIYNSQGNASGIVAIANDISERKRQEHEIEKKNMELSATVLRLETTNEELQTSEEELISAEEELRTQVEEMEKSHRSLMESEEKFRIALKNAKIFVFTHNYELIYMWIYNPPEGLTHEMIIGNKDSDFLEKKEAEKVMQLKRKVLITGIPENCQMELIVAGRRCFFNYTIEPVFDKNNKVSGLLGAAMDITEKKNVEEELFQVYKMEAIGQLAGGIAHDFNNMLAGIMGNAEMLQFKLSNESSLLVNVENILKASEHASHLTSQLLSFARKGQYQRVSVSIHRIVSDVVSILESTIDKKITIEQSLKANPNTVVGDPTQIQNAILNLAINARDAIIKQSGKIIISTETLTLTKDYVEKFRKDIKAGQYVVISITDNGMGMTDEVKKHLFEPFFTTKEPGKGTGLGLASIYGTVKSHNGIIDVYSEAGTGTTMKIYLPLSVAELITEEKAFDIRSIDGHGKTVLVVDDEELIRETTLQILSKYGFEVLTAKDGREAIEIYKENMNHIDIILLDMIMPEIGGKETFKELRNINSNVKVILSSGFSAEGEARETINLGVNGFIQKPFRVNELLKKIGEILNQN